MNPPPFPPDSASRPAFRPDGAEPVLLRLAETASTNDVALRLAREGAPAFSAVAADRQTAGRGRAGHDWASPPGVGLYLSVVLRPSGGPEGAALVPLAAGAAVAEAVRDASGAVAFLKWPNDVLLLQDGGLRKVAGILCEAEETPSGFAVACGIGVNADTPPELLPERPVFPATSLRAATGATQDREALLRAVLVRLRERVALLESPDGAAATVRAFNERDALARFVRPPARVRADLPGGRSAAGIPRGANAAGHYLLDAPDGPFEVVAGSLSVESAPC